jgi:hypothetical protein
LPGSRLEYQAENLAILRVVGVRTGRRLNQRRDFEPRVLHLDIDDVNTFDGRNVPGQKIVRITPGDNLRSVNIRMVLRQVKLALAAPVRD